MVKSGLVLTSAAVGAGPCACPNEGNPRKNKHTQSLKNFLFFKTTESTEVWLPPIYTETAKIINAIDPHKLNDNPRP